MSYAKVDCSHLNPVAERLIYGLLSADLMCSSYGKVGYMVISATHLKERWIPTNWRHM